MRRYLVVANQTLDGPQLLDELRARVAEGPTSLHVLVPAEHHDGGLYTEGQIRAEAQRRLDAAIGTFRGLGAAEVTGEVGDHRPLDAIQDVLRHRTFDAIILSTLPLGRSKWLGQDLPSRIRRHVAVPLVHVAPAPATV
jgi:GABA permease